MKYYRLLTTMPLLPEEPKRPPVRLGEVIEAFRDELAGCDLRMAENILGFLDCRNVAAILGGYDTFDDRAPVSRSQIVERRELPDHLAEFFMAYDAGELGDQDPQDALWLGYLAFLIQAGERACSRFVAAWASFELDVRTHLTPWRMARRAALGGRSHAGSTRVSDDIAALVAGLEEAPDPLERERVLDTRRLEEIDALSGNDPFSPDAALAYLATTLILDSWDFSETADLAAMLEDFS